MDLAARKAANLTVLRRHDPAIVDLLDQSGHAVIYSFDRSKAGWAKKGIEGTVFLFKRNIPPHYGIYILNRLSIDNYELFLTDDLVIELQDEYIIYQTPSEDICCLWLYETGDRERISEEMISMRDASKATKSIDVKTLFGSALTTVQKPTQTTLGTSVSLDQLFGKATIAEQQPVSSPPVGKSVDLAALFQAANPPQKAPMLSQQVPPSQPDQALSLNDLFNRAMHQPNQSPVQNDRQSSNPSLALLNELQGNPVKEPVVMVEQQQVQPPNPSNTLLDLLKRAQPNRSQPSMQSPPATLNMHSPAHNQPAPPQTFSPPPQRSVQQQQSPLPPATVVNGSSKPSANPLLALLQGSNVNKPQHGSASPPQNKVTSPRINQRATSPRMSQRGSPMRSPKAQASKLTLLDTLMGATPAKPLPTPPLQPQPQQSSPPPPPPLQQRRSISGAPPLMSQQAHELASAHALDRIKTPSVLSKPEFIQQFLNIIQSDASFLDALYTDYVNREASMSKPPYATSHYPPQAYGVPYQGAQMMYGNGAIHHQ